MPRYTGVRTFARLPHTQDLDGVDAAVVGVPFDTATSYRPGARFGPEAIRAGSTLLRPYHPAVQVDVFGAARAGLIVAGYEINHLHVHVWPSRSMAEFNFATADQNPDPKVLDANAEKLRQGLRDAGYGEFVPD